MPSKTDTVNPPKRLKSSPSVQENSQEKLDQKRDRIANKAAKRAGNRTKRYESEHGIFTK